MKKTNKIIFSLALVLLFSRSVLALNLPACGEYGPTEWINGDTATHVTMFYASGNANFISYPGDLFTPENMFIDFGRIVIAGCNPDHTLHGKPPTPYAKNTFVNGLMTKQVVTQQGDTVTLNYTYDTNGRLTTGQQLCFGGGDPTILFDMAFNYDSQGRLIKMTRTGPQSCWAPGVSSVEYSYEDPQFPQLPTAVLVNDTSAGKTVYAVVYTKNDSDMVGKIAITAYDGGARRMKIYSTIFNLTYTNGLITFNSAGGYNFNYTYNNQQLTKVTSSNPEVKLETITYKNGVIHSIENKGGFVDTISTFTYFNLK